VGLSQPQLSRILHKLEEQFELSLLDRSSRRHSSWTAAAHRLAEAFDSCSRDMDRTLSDLQAAGASTDLRIGTLEGLAPLCCHYAARLLESGLVRQIDIEVEDLNRLSEHFVEGGFDLAFTSREPGKKKYPLLKILGYQSLRATGQARGPLVKSSSESSRPTRAAHEVPRITSNSLVVKKIWIENYSGRGVVPTPLYRKPDVKAQNEQSVFLIGADSMPSALRAYAEKINPFDRRIPEYK
jgi:DNA-binding transcriptional LysR family regulator